MHLLPIEAGMIRTRIQKWKFTIWFQEQQEIKSHNKPPDVAIDIRKQQKKNGNFLSDWRSLMAYTLMDQCKSTYREVLLNYFGFDNLCIFWGATSIYRFSLISIMRLSNIILIYINSFYSSQVDKKTTFHFWPVRY